jgi:hypothetical protein
METLAFWDIFISPLELGAFLHMCIRKFGLLGF